MDIISLVMFVYILLIFMFISKAIKASARRKTMQNRTAQPRQNTVQKQYTYNRPAQKTSTGSEYINNERKKESKKKITVFGKKDPDCDLDERYFGSKNQNKDLW
ncbi:MAG: DUF4834 family protein [Firmicutes bacterium]|nr:DUF4834 family protein [Bacillota bacterium]